jgi:SWI/SNF-related matrix-associated actin-dependent regulator of chromatin subfamily A member 5
VQSTSASKLSTPALDGADVLSDYIPQSNEISRVPSTAGGPDEDAERRDQVAVKDEQDDQDEQDEEEDDAEYDSEGNVVMNAGGANGKGKSKTAVKKEAKRKFDEKVSASPDFPDLSLAGASRCQEPHSWKPLGLTLTDLDPQLASRRSTQASLKSADSIKRFTYLLGQTDLFKHFCDLKVGFMLTL